VIFIRHFSFLEIAETPLLDCLFLVEIQVLLPTWKHPLKAKRIISHYGSTISCNWSWVKQFSLFKCLNHGYDGDNYIIFHSTRTINWDERWILALSYSNSNPPLIIRIPNRNCVTNMHIIYLPNTQRSQSLWMNIITSECKIEQKMMNPSMNHPFH
jgi:hypothetical protein